ncbi:DUF4097 family beta strand repeat-containing protein [Rhodocytophaga aerolata]|uniref:DUF4097 family beta strand repeat-containing protein n=1 Tax=Rhodocytophaga aerolata TaxID=455078 RepID=A0ABT8R710_9BACT|nr:DUF4097 family beta strand repeat-containing protein [Rhodocytophaga aerolata]MDO1447114.1 DUF4097 family beta strand repeat-containing protein [Rhodocytophaga aerolata]
MNKIGYGYIIRYIFLLALISTQPLLAIAQEKIQVVTKTLDKRITYTPGEVLNIDARKASVEVIGWKENYIQLTLKLIAKHPVRHIAENDLEHLKYEIKKESNTHIFTNYFHATASDDKVRSNLKAQYQIKAPAGCQLRISNAYGNIQIENLSGETEVSINFGELQLTDIKGSTVVNSSYGDIKGENVTGLFVCKAEKANIHLTRAAGMYDIHNTYGQITISATPKLTKLTIAATRTSVTMDVPAFEQYNYSLSTSFSDIQLPPHAPGDITRNIAGKKTYTSGNIKSSASTVQISTTFSPITIYVQSHAAQK